MCSNATYDIYPIVKKSTITTTKTATKSAKTATKEKNHFLSL